MRSLAHTIHALVHDSHSEKPDNSLLWIVVGLCGGVVLALMTIIAMVPKY
jgi:hypothetical protein